MSEARVSIVMTGCNRTPLLERTLTSLCRWQTFSLGFHELVFVDDQSDDPIELRRVLTEFRPYFEKVVLVHMDKKLSKIPVIFNNPALGMNLAVKAAANEIIYKTDPEGMPLTETVKFAQYFFDPAKLWFAKVRLLSKGETSKFSLDVLRSTHPAVVCEKSLAQLEDLWYISEKNKKPYWYGAVFSRSVYLQIGGIDEEFLRGFAGEDDDWAERMMRAGVKWCWSDNFCQLHQYHGEGSKEWFHSPAHFDNIKRLHESRAQARVEVNQGYDWGSRGAVLATEVL